MGTSIELGDREFTSEEVAALCGVTRVTVADWISRGRLAVRWTTGGHRRIPRASLSDFMRGQGYEVPRAVASNRALTVILERDDERARAIRTALGTTDEFELQVRRPDVEALLALGASRPDLVVFGTRVPGFDAPQLVTALREHPATREAALVAVTPTDEDAAPWRRLGVDIVISLNRLDGLRENAIRWLTERQRRVANDAPAPSTARGRAKTSTSRPSPASARAR